VLSYSRARGLFAGISLTGSTLRVDNNANQKLYGQDISGTAIALQGKVPPPPSARKLLSALTKASPKHAAD
jgi:SH3 domain-containing YSC84-like protein 1